MNKELIKDLNNINIATQKAKLGDIIIELIKENEELKKEIKSIKDSKTETIQEENEKLLEKQEKSKASTIKELVNDFNGLISNLEKSGYMKK